jgi:hypothetical protein
MVDDNKNYIKEFSGGPREKPSTKFLSTNDHYKRGQKRDLSCKVKLLYNTNFLQFERNFILPCWAGINVFLTLFVTGL